jgi:hypothetical protein
MPYFFGCMFYKVLLLLHMPCLNSVQGHSESGHTAPNFCTHSFREKVLRLFLGPYPPPPPPQRFIKVLGVFWPPRLPLPLLLAVYGYK